MRWSTLGVGEGATVRTPAAEFERVMLPHLDSAHNLARWLVADASLAEDVVQDAVVRAIGYFGSFRGGDARSWLLRIVRNAAYTALGARRRLATTSLDSSGTDETDCEAMQVADPAGNPEESLAEGERHAVLAEALARLPIEWRECLVLRELDEMSYKEIAEVTGVPVGTVMSRLWRARQALLRGRVEEVA